MKLNHAVVESIHIFEHENYNVTSLIKSGQIGIAKKRDSPQYYFLIKKGENYDSNTKYSYINYLEKSFNLIHPSIINLSGYSISKPYLYYRYNQGSYDIDFKTLSDEQIQIIFVGIAEGLSYLLLNGYAYSTFSINSIIFDSKFFPHLIDYLNYDDQNKSNENDLVIQYVNLLRFILKEKYKEIKIEDLINKELNSLFQRCKRKVSIPTFEDFLKSLKKQSFHEEWDMITWDKFRIYLKLFHLHDKIIYDHMASRKHDNFIENIKTIEQICFYFYKNYYKEKKELDEDGLFLLNSLPENYIKSLTKFISPLHDKLNRFLYNENISLIIPDWLELLKFSPFKIYKEIMKQMKNLEKQKNDVFYCDKKSNELDNKIDALRIQAIEYLEKAAENQNEIEKEIEIKIELAVQYIKGYLVECNLTKALNVLESIPSTVNNSLVNQMKTKILDKSASIEYTVNHNQQIQNEILEKANNGDVLALLYLGFAFYTGFDQYPILHSLSFHYYNEAADKSPYAMFLLGYFYYKGLIFPQNLKKAQELFKKAAQNGCIKAEIINNLLGKHVWRNYLADFDIDDIFNYYLQSFELNNMMHFSEINYNIENHIKKKMLGKLKLIPSNDGLKSNRKSSMTLKLVEIEKFPVNIIHENFEKVLLQSEKIENTKDPLKIALKYYYGEDDFPVNYTEAAKFFKLAADKGNSEAQWRYALLIINNICPNQNEKVEEYLQKSAKKDIRGKFYYAFWVKKYKKDLQLFERLIRECCDAGDIESMYYYGMYLEKMKYISQSIECYEKAATLGHFDAIIRLTKLSERKLSKEEELSKKELSKEELLEHYLPIGIINDNFLSRSIEHYDQKKDFKQSNILIQIGIMKNPQLFNFFYSEHLLYGREMDINIEKAKKLALSAFENEYKDRYLKRYIYIILQIHVDNNEHKKALDFLLKYRNLITRRFKDHFHSFYKKFDKKLALDYFIPACFYSQQFQACHNLLMQFYEKKSSLLDSFQKLIDYAEEDNENDDVIECNNPYAMAILGKIYKQEKKLIIRNLETSIKYFAHSAKLNCPLGYYYIGKEYYYGRYLEKNKAKAKKYLEAAIKNNEEPRAGYYLYKLTNKTEKLLVGVEYGHNRALLRHGKNLYKSGQKEEGIRYIKKACEQKFKKAYRFCLTHGIHFIDIIETNSRNKEEKVIKGKQISSNDSISSIENENMNESSGLSIDIHEDDELNINNKDKEENNDVNDSINYSNESDSDIIKFWS